MDRPPHGLRLWLAPAIGGLGLGFGVVSIVAGLNRGAGILQLVASLALATLVVVLSILLVAEQQGWRSTASRIGLLEEELAFRQQALSEAGARDPLTGLPNRVAFYEMLELDFQRWRRERQSFACVLIDLDHFRHINDRFGHHFGDMVLITFARLLTRLLRGADAVCRYEGDEFMLLLGESNAAQAMAVAERVREQLKREVFSDGTAAAAVTASVGIASVPAPGVSRPNHLIERVEAALEDAKRGGRDRVAVDRAVMFGAADNSEEAGASAY